MGFGTPPTTVITKHTELTDKETAGVIDHADLSVTDGKLASGVGLSDGQILKLPTAAADKVLKRGAAAWEAGDVELEGDYSDWTIYDSFDEAYVSNAWGRQGAAVNKAETKILICDRYNIVAIEYDIATKTPSSPIATDADFAESYAKYFISNRSIQQTYYVAIKNTLASPTGIIIFKDATIVKTLLLADLGLTTLYSADISPSGKYITVSGTRSASGNRGWVVLVGS